MSSPLVSLHIVLADPRPISVNHMYGVDHHGKMRLTAAGQEYEDALKVAVVAQTHKHDWKKVTEEIYARGGYVSLHIALYLEKVQNKAWKKGTTSRTEGGRLRSPYQRVDGSNYIKAIEDGVVKGTGIDDSCHLGVSLEKMEDPSRPRVEITYVVFCGN